MDDRIEVYGEGGVTYANLHMGNALPTYSEYGFGYAVEKAPTTQGWSYPVFEELWNYGFPQEMRTSRAACAAKRRLRLRAKTAASYWKLFMRLMRRRDKDGRLRCRGSLRD